MLHGEVGLNRKKAGERVALLVGKLRAETVRVEDRLTLRLRHLAQVAECAGNQAAAILS